MSYYAFFKGWLLLSQPPDCFSLPTTKLYIGTNGYADTGMGLYRTWNGSIDTVVIWNRTVTADEVLDLYRLRNGSYYWYVNVTDGTTPANSSTWKFTVGEVAGNHPPYFGYRIYQPTESTSNDTHIQDTSIDTQITSTSSNLSVGRESGIRYRSILYFDTTAIPPEANVTSSASNTS